MTPDELPEIELDMEGGEESYPDTLSCEAGQAHFGVDAQTFLEFWLGKLGIPVEGGALVLGEGTNISILHPETGKFMSCEEIAKVASANAKAGKLRSVQ